MKNEKPLALGIVFGALAGSVIGALTNNMGLWIPVGLAIGAGIGTVIRKKQ